MAQIATIILTGSLSHSVTLDKLPEIKFVKGVPYPTTDQRLIDYAKARPQFFSVGTKKAAAAPARKPEPEPEPEPEGPEEDQPGEPAPPAAPMRSKRGGKSTRKPRTRGVQVD